MKIVIERNADGAGTTATDASGNLVNMYLPDIAGGAGEGIRPMQMLIMGVGGCTAVDVLMILRKKRQTVDSFKIEINAEREPDKEPSVWTTVHLRYIITGKVGRPQAERAIQMSLEKYCSASETLRLAGAAITWELSLDE